MAYIEINKGKKIEYMEKAVIVRKNWKKTNMDKDYCIKEITDIRSYLKTIDGRVLIRFLNSGNETEIEMELPLNDNWDDYLNSYNLKKDLLNKKI